MNKTADRIYAALVQYCEEHGYSPTLAELAEAAGLTTDSAVVYHVRTMAAEGLVTYRPFTARSIRPVVKERSDDPPVS